jgi:hypothetical protein
VHEWLNIKRCKWAGVCVAKTREIIIYDIEKKQLFELSQQSSMKWLIIMTTIDTSGSSQTVSE